MSFSQHAACMCLTPQGFNGAIRRDHSSGTFDLWNEPEQTVFTIFSAASELLAKVVTPDGTSPLLGKPNSSCFTEKRHAEFDAIHLFCRVWRFPPLPLSCSPGTPIKGTGTLSKPAATARGLFLCPQEISCTHLLSPTQ